MSLVGKFYKWQLTYENLVKILHLKKTSYIFNRLCIITMRGASTSAATSKGVHVMDILAVADWSRDSTFKRF